MVVEVVVVVVVVEDGHALWAVEVPGALGEEGRGSLLAPRLHSSRSAAVTVSVPVSTTSR